MFYPETIGTPPIPEKFIFVSDICEPRLDIASALTIVSSEINMIHSNMYNMYHIYNIQNVYLVYSQGMSHPHVLQHRAQCLQLVPSCEDMLQPSNPYQPVRNVTLKVYAVYLFIKMAMCSTFCKFFSNLISYPCIIIYDIFAGFLMLMLGRNRIAMILPHLVSVNFIYLTQYSD